MEKTVRIDFNGLAKSTTANVRIEYKIEFAEKQEFSNEEMLEEAKKLYNMANEHAETITKMKMLGETKR